MLHGSFFISGFWYAAYQDATCGGSQVIDRTSGWVPLGSPSLGALGPPVGILLALLGCFLGVRVLPKVHLKLCPILGALLGPFLGPLGVPWVPLGPPRVPLGSPLGPPWVLLGSSLGPPWRPAPPPWHPFLP